MTSPRGGVTAAPSSPRRGHHHRPDESIGGKNATAICRRSPNDDPEYVSWRDEGCRLIQLSPRYYTAAAAAGSVPDRGNCCNRLKYNTYYQDLVRQKLDQQQADHERQQMKILNDNRHCIFRAGGKGAPWRQLKLTTGAKGENVMFVDGDVKTQDMLKFYPAETDNNGERRLVRGPPRPLPHFYVSNVTLDPNKTATLLKELDNDERSPSDAKTPRSCRENSQPNGDLVK